MSIKLGTVRLTPRQQEVIQDWAHETRFMEGFAGVRQVFGGNNAADNGRRRVMYNLLEKGLLAVSDEGVPKGCCPLVRCGNCLNDQALETINKTNNGSSKT